MVKRVLAGVLTALSVCGIAAGQDYSFSVPEMEMHNTIRRDGSVDIEYRITFYCNTGAHPIDIVDIGMPNTRYDISNMKAVLGGTTLGPIRPSQYIACGVEVPLSPPVQPGRTGVFTLTFTMPDMVYQDTTAGGDASFQITPTWFDANALTGTTKLLVAIYVPDDVPLESITHHGVNFTQKLDLDNNNAVVWLFKTTRIDHEHRVGISFPRRGAQSTTQGAAPPVEQQVVPMTLWGLGWKWWTEAGETRTAVGLLLLILFGVVYYHFSRGAGTCLFIPMVVTLLLLWSIPDAGPVFEVLFIPGLAIIWFTGRAYVRARRSDYLPPIESVRGGGIKRGLAVPEAAVLLEQPLGRVLTMVLFGMLQKGLVTLVDEDPLTLDVPREYDADRGERRRQAKVTGAAVRAYEMPFLDIIARNPRRPVAKLNFSEPMKQLIEHAARRVTGFDLEQTREYYVSIVRKAWRLAKGLGEPQQRNEFMDSNLLWLMMAEDSHEQFVGLHERGYDHRPAWSRMGAPHEDAPPTRDEPPAAAQARPPWTRVSRYSGTAHRPARTSEIVSASPPRGPSRPAPGDRTSFGDVAASFAGWMEKVSGDIANTFDPVQVSMAGRGGVRLRGVDRVGIDTLNALERSPAPKPSPRPPVTPSVDSTMWSSSSDEEDRDNSGSSSRSASRSLFDSGSSSSSSSHSSDKPSSSPSCACACAGCACACACAGGGR